MSKSRFFLNALLLLSLAATLSCKAVSTVSPPGDESLAAPDTSRGLFNERWWNYYDRGLSFAQDGEWSEAIGDFESAIQKRGEDAWRARTYGMHFVDYFPNRELGIALIRQGDTARAEQLLQQSMDQAPSSRAAHFLNEARRLLLESKAADREGPEFTLNKSRGSVSRTPVLRVDGTLRDVSGVAALIVAGQEEYIELASPEYAFASSIPLHAGMNSITITGADLAGNVTTLTWETLYDPVGPMVAVDRSAGAIRCRVSDNEGVVLVKAGDRILWRGNQKEVALDVPPEAGHSSAIRASDAAGNETVLPLQPVNAAGMARQWGRLAGRGASPAMAALRPVNITIVDPPARTPLSEAALLLRVDSAARVKEVTVNGMPIERIPRESSWCVYRLVDLPTRANTVEVRAVNEDGAASEDRCVVRRDFELLDDHRTKLRMDILPLGDKEGSEYENRAWTLFERRMTGLERFRFIDRSLLPYSLQELVLQKAGIARKNLDPATVMISPESVTRMGFSGRYQSRWGGWNGTEIEARAYNVWTGEVYSVDDVFVPDEDKDNLDYYMKGLALKVAQRFPRIDSRIREVVAGKGFVIDSGSNAGLKLNMKAVAIHEDPDGFEDPVIVECTVTKAAPNEARLKCLEPGKMMSILPGDGTLTK